MIVSSGGIDPPPPPVAAMANQTAEVISVNELSSRKRVGVRVVNSDIFDAVPLEALIPIDKGTDKDVVSDMKGPTAIVSAPKVNITAIRKPKSAARSVKVAPATEGYTPQYVLSVSGANRDRKPQRPQTAGATHHRVYKKDPVVLGESEREMNTFYLQEVTAPMRGAFASHGGGREKGHEEREEEEPESGRPDDAIAHSSHLFSIDPVVTPLEAREPVLPSSPSRVAQHELRFDSQGAKWAMPSTTVNKNRKQYGLTRDTCQAAE